MRGDSTGSDASGGSLRDGALEAMDTSAQVQAMDQARRLREDGALISDESLEEKNFRDGAEYELFGGLPVPNKGKIVAVVPAPPPGFAGWCQFKYRSPTADQQWFVACMFAIGEEDQAAKLTKQAMRELMKNVGKQDFCDRFAENKLAEVRAFVEATKTDGSPYFAASDVLDEKRIGSLIAGKTSKALFEKVEELKAEAPSSRRVIETPPFLPAGGSQTRGRAEAKRKAGAAAEAPKKKTAKPAAKKPAAKKPAAKKPASRAK